MALNIGASGAIRPYAKYNLKSDKWFVRGEGGGDLEIARPSFLLDLENIRTGWLHFADGQAPQRLIDPALDKVAPKADAGDRQLPLARRRAEGRDGPRSAGPALGQLVDAARQRRGEGRAAPGLRGGRSTTACANGADSDPWGHTVWAACADGKLRRTQPGLGLLAHGVSERVARLRALGNAIVPRVAARILAAILASEADR